MIDENMLKMASSAFALQEIYRKAQGAAGAVNPAFLRMQDAAKLASSAYGIYAMQQNPALLEMQRTAQLISTAREVNDPAVLEMKKASAVFSSAKSILLSDAQQKLFDSINVLQKAAPQIQNWQSLVIDLNPQINLNNTVFNEFFAKYSYENIDSYSDDFFDDPQEIQTITEILKTFIGNVFDSDIFKIFTKKDIYLLIINLFMNVVSAWVIAYPDSVIQEKRHLEIRQEFHKINAEMELQREMLVEINAELKKSSETAEHSQQEYDQMPEEATNEDEQRCCCKPIIKGESK